MCGAGGCETRRDQQEVDLLTGLSLEDVTSDNIVFLDASIWAHTPTPTHTHPHAHTPRPSLGKYLNTAALSNLWLACYQSGPDSTHASLHHQSSLSVWTVLACVTESTGLYLCVQAGDYK